MKHVELSEFVSAVPVKMSKQQKLLRWAELVRNHDCVLALYHNLEYVSLQQLDATPVSSPRTAFAIAAADPVFKTEGLGDHPSLGDMLRFFELSQADAHEFSCDCGGSINNRDQARRIERLAR